jgi:hypothetical protein
VALPASISRSTVESSLVAMLTALPCILLTSRTSEKHKRLLQEATAHAMVMLSEVLCAVDCFKDVLSTAPWSPEETTAWRTPVT